MEETVKHKHPVQNTFQAVGSKYIKFACLYQSIWYTLESEKKTYLFFCLHYCMPKDMLWVHNSCYKYSQHVLKTSRIFD